MKDISVSSLVFKLNLPNDPVLIQGERGAAVPGVPKPDEKRPAVFFGGFRVYITLYRNDSWTTVVIKTPLNMSWGISGGHHPAVRPGETLPESTELRAGAFHRGKLYRSLRRNLPVTTDADLFTVEITFQA